MIKSDGINKRIASQLPRLHVSIPRVRIKYSYAIILRVLSHGGALFDRRLTAATSTLLQSNRT